MLVPLIEEGDEEEVEPDTHFVVNTVTNGDDRITAVGKTHKSKKELEILDDSDS